MLSIVVHKFCCNSDSICDSTHIIGDKMHTKKNLLYPPNSFHYLQFSNMLEKSIRPSVGFMFLFEDIFPLLFTCNFKFSIAPYSLITDNVYLFHEIILYF